MNSQVIYVLLVEDDIDYSSLLRRRLMGSLNKDTSLTFVVAQTGFLREAVNYTTEHTVDVIVLDLNLPDASGLQTLERIRAVAPDAATIVLTGRDDQALATQAVKMGAQDYLFKGNFNTELLIRAIRYAIDRKESERALFQAKAQLQEVHGEPKDNTNEMDSTTVAPSEEMAHDFDTLLARMAAQNSMALSELPNDNPARVHVEKLNQTINLASALTRRLFQGLRSSNQP